MGVLLSPGTPNQKFACFVLHLKIIDTFVKMMQCNLE